MINGRLMMIKNAADETLDRRNMEVNRVIKMTMVGELPIKILGDNKFLELKLELKIDPGIHDHLEVKKALKLEEHGDRIEITLLTVDNRTEDGIQMAIDEKKRISSYFK